VQQAYGISAAKLRMVPWGANLPQVPSRAEVDRMIQGRGRDPVVLSAIGVHWERKGGDTIVAAYRSLRRSGINVRLNVIGMTPPTEVHEGIHFLPFADKSTPHGFRKIADLLAATHVLVAPSRVEAFGHVFAEAAAFGVPAVGADVGGVSTSIKDGVNGRLLPPDATGEDYAGAVEQLLATPQTYLQAAHASRARFEHDLNWPAFCRTIVDEVAALGAARRESLHEDSNLAGRRW
jgi:glycosyltransferase involved in cell wall biosynthesis